MNDEPKTPWIERSAGRLIGVHVFMGIVHGLVFALVYSGGLPLIVRLAFAVRLATICAVGGLVGGLVAWRCTDPPGEFVDSEFVRK